MPVVSLELVDPRFYHLDTALAVLDDTTIAYYPPAFSDEARTRLLELFPDAIEVAERRRLRARPQRRVRRPATSSIPRPPPASPSNCATAGFRPIGVDLSELLKGGGSVKCCTLEVHP